MPAWKTLINVLPAMLLIGIGPAPGIAQEDVRGIDDRLQSRVAHYDFALRLFAPFPARDGPTCHETVGRFCLVYGHGKDISLPFETPELQVARDEAIAALRSAAMDQPHDTSISGRLVRLLVEAHDGRGAVDAALAFTVADTADAWSYLLLGFALNADEQIVASENAFDAALDRMSADERSRAIDAYYLLAPDERDIYRLMAGGRRASYLAALWRAADPLYLTPGNEARAEHLARYVYTRLLARVASGHTVPPWGVDLEELTRRFGVPVGTGPRWPCENDGRLAFDTHSERRRLDAQLGVPGSCEGEVRSPSGIYDPDQLTFVPPEFSSEMLPRQADPGTTEWFYGPIAERNGFLPRTLRDIRPLEHQLSRFPAGDSAVIRTDVLFAVDEVVPAAALVEIALFVLDSTLNIVSEARDTVRSIDRVARGWLEANLPADAFAYSVEARETVTGLAARSRHPLPPVSTGDLMVSDPVILPADTSGALRGQPSFRPFGSLLLSRDEEISVYLELAGMEPGDDGRVEYRIALGMAEGRDEPVQSGSLSWTGGGSSADWVPVRIDLGRIPTGAGLRRLVFTITDSVTGKSSTIERLLKFR